MEGCLPPAEGDGPQSSRLRSGLLIVAGIAVMVLWSAANIVWIAMSLMGTLMANDSGRASQSLHLTLIGGTLGAQILVAMAGIPLGMSLFWCRRRKMLLWIFCAMLVAGLIGQAAALGAFFYLMSA